MSKWIECKCSECGAEFEVELENTICARCPKCNSLEAEIIGFKSVEESLTVAAKTEEPQRALSVEDVRALFPSNLEELLIFEKKDNTILVRPRRFLGSDNFAKIAHIVRSNGGEYISAGKQSHFRMPAKKE